MSDELKPCPFCGERPRLTLRPDNAEGTAYFAAVACYCGGYSACAYKMATAPEASEAEAIACALWNRRAAAQPPAAMPVPPSAWIDDVMEQAQVFASAWSLVGGRFEFGRGLTDAEEAKAELRAMLAAAPTPQAQSVPATGAQPLTEDQSAAIFKAWRDGPLWLHMTRGTEAAHGIGAGTERAGHWCAAGQQGVSDVGTKHPPAVGLANNPRRQGH